MNFVVLAYICGIPLGWGYFGQRFFRDEDSPEHGNLLGAAALGCIAGCLWLPASLMWWKLSRPLKNEGPC
jgi:hypothetical protein